MRTPVIPITPPDARHLLDRLVGLAARMAGGERAAVGMRDQDRLLRDLESVERRAVAAMRNVHGHPDLVHPLDDRDAEIADAFVAPFGRAVADQVARVVSELRDALAEAAERIDVGRAAEMLGILHAQNHADFA